MFGFKKKITKKSIVKETKKGIEKGRSPIRGIVRCECPNHKCEKFSRFRDYLCDDCYGKVKCSEEEVK